MANGRRRPIAPVRKLVAAVLGTFATFVVLFGLGLGSFAIVALGVALLVLAISLVLVTAVRGGARAWVAGIAHVHTVAEPPASSVFGRCEMQIVIDAPGLPPRSVKVRDPRVPVSKWPRPGAILPIMVAIDDQRRVRIMWDDVLTHAEAGGARRGYRPDPLAADFDDDLTDDLGGRPDEPVVMHQTPSGTIVVEGRLVDPPPVIPLPRRADPGPYPAGGLARRPAAEAPGGPDSTAETVVNPAVDATADVPAPPAADVAVGTPGDADAGPDLAPDGSTDHPFATGSDGRGGDSAMLLDELYTASGRGGPGRAGVINGVGVTVLVTDLDRSLRFYRDTLGFSPIDGAEGNAVLASGGTRLVLRATRDITPVNRRLVHLNLEVGDLDAVYADLRSKGVRFTYPPRAVNRGKKLELWAAAFRDPDGHGVALTQWRNRATS